MSTYTSQLNWNVDMETKFTEYISIQSGLDCLMQLSLNFVQFGTTWHCIWLSIQFKSKFISIYLFLLFWRCNIFFAGTGFPFLEAIIKHTFQTFFFHILALWTVGIACILSFCISILFGMWLICTSLICIFMQICRNNIFPHLLSEPLVQPAFDISQITRRLLKKQTKTSFSKKYNCFF